MRGNKKMKRLAIAVSIVAALALVPAAVASGTLTGKYRTTVKSGRLAGTYTLDFKKGSVKVTVDGHLIGRSSVSFNGKKITIGHGANCSSNGTYKFKLTGTRLKFTRIKDPCVNRRTVLSHTFTRVS